MFRSSANTIPSFFSYPYSESSRTKGKYEAEIAELTRELEAMRDKWTKSRDEAAKKDEELIVVKALLKQKEVSLQQALEVSTYALLCTVLSTYVSPLLGLAKTVSEQVKRYVVIS